MKIKFGIAILCAFVLIINSAGMYAWQMQEVKLEKEDKPIPTTTNGIFTAEIGEKESEPLYYLNGNWNKDKKGIKCDGTVEKGDQEGVFTGWFTEGKKGGKTDSYFKIEIKIEEETIDFNGGYILLKNANFQGKWCAENKCFDFVYPISYIMPDGTIITGDSEEEIWKLIKAWYEEHPDEKEKPELMYPVDIKYEDGTIVTINNEGEMKEAYEKCDDDKEWGWIKGTFQGMQNNQRTVTNLRDGTFFAELGIRGNERPIIELQGTYQSRGRLIFVKGDDDHRFTGMFRGNVFFIRTQLRGRTFTIYGKCRFGEDNSFSGVWISRGLQTRGWIEGLFD